MLPEFSFFFFFLFSVVTIILFRAAGRPFPEISDTLLASDEITRHYRVFLLNIGDVKEKVFNC